MIKTFLSYVLALTSVSVVTLLTGCVSPQATTPPEEHEPYYKKTDYLPIGFISTVNVVEGFVVVNFSGSAMPWVGDELKVYRSGRPIGTVKITKPIYRPMATADILTGELQRGDAVRP